MKRQAPIAAIESTEQNQFQAKTELTVLSVDMLMFRGPVKTMLEGMARMAGLPALSIGLILPTKSERNTRDFLASVISIIALVLDDQVEFAKFTALLAGHVKTVQRIAAEEEGA